MRRASDGPVAAELRAQPTPTGGGRSAVGGGWSCSTAVGAGVAVRRRSGALPVAARRPHVPDLGGEILGRGERPVHRGEPQVGDLVQVAQRPEDRQPDVLALHLRLTRCPHGLLDLLGEQGDRIRRRPDGPGRPGSPRRSTLLRLNGSVTPLRLTTDSNDPSTVVNRREHSGQDRRRRIAWPSSTSRESMTRESG